MFRTRLIAIVACGFAAAVLISGCGPKKKPTRTAATQPNPQAEVMTDTNVRMSELRKRSEELNQAAQQLPGRAAADDRKLVADAFDKAAGSLELLGGPNPGGAFRQQLRIIENTRNFLSSGTGNVAADPSVDTGLRSLENALSGVRENLFSNDPKVKDELDKLRTRLTELDTVRGPIHSLVVAQAFQSAANVVDTMSKELDARNAAANPPPAPPTAPAMPAPSAAAVPAAASTPPAPAPAVAPAPAASAKPQAAPPAAAPAPAPPQPSPQQVEQLQQLQKQSAQMQQQLEELRKQNEQLQKQLQQLQEQKSQPAPAK